MGLLPLWTGAQELTLQDLFWIDPTDAPEVLPTLEADGKTVRVLDGMAEFDEPFYRDTLYFVMAEKKRPKATIIRQVSGSEWLGDILPEGLRGGFKTPALRGGKPVASEVRSIVIYNPKSATTRGDEATPRLIRVVPPQFPSRAEIEDRVLDRRVGMAKVQVGADGRVSGVEFPETLEPAFVRLGRRAVMQWEFNPARSGGQPVAGEVTVPVIFQRPSSGPAKGKRTPPKLVREVRPVYPQSMHRAGIEGRVKVSFEVTVEGRTANVFVVESNNPNFDDAAVDAVMQWTFEPAQVDGRPVRIRMGVPVVFGITGGGASMFSVTRPKSFAADLPEPFKFDEPPEIIGVASPVYPLPALREGREGKVKVGFFVGPGGAVEKSTIIAGVGADLDGATLAAVERLRFKPAVKNGQPCWAALNIEFEFKGNGRGDVQVDAGTRRLLRLLVEHREQLVPLAELDGVPEPVSRQPPRYPLNLDDGHGPGSALIEFVIDRRGFARLPTVVEATAPAFGYAAVQAVATWRFEPPRRDGQAVDAIVRIPVTFGLK